MVWLYVPGSACSTKDCAPASNFLAPDTAPFATSEREAYVASELVARMADGSLDEAPIWSDLLTFDGGPWRGVVDCITAGFPCQPHSLAGKRSGLDDERWIWPDITRTHSRG